MRFYSRLGAAALVLSLSANSVLADFITPAFRGDANTTYQAWDIFTSATGANAPDVAMSNLNGVASVTETTGTAFVTSGGNIYSFAAATAFNVEIPDFNLGGGYITNAVVQIRTQGTEIDTSSVLFNGVAASSATLLFTQALGGFGGALEDWEFVFSNVPGSIASDLITFNASGSSMSLDKVSVDTHSVAVPEAGTLIFTGMSVLGAGLYLRHRRSK